MAAARDEFLQDVRDYVEAGERLREGIAAFNAMNTAALEDLEGGMTLTESFAQALQDEGQTTRSIASAFGTTRQWAERILRGAPPKEQNGAG